MRLILAVLSLCLSLTAEASTIRLATVRTDMDAGLLDAIIDTFQKKTNSQITIYTGEDVYEKAKTGAADLVLSHFRHQGLGDFVSSGFGRWPVPVMANVTAFLAPMKDPAQIVGVNDPVEIFKRIAQTKSAFLVNGDPNSKYLLETLWNAAGRPDKTSWYRDDGLQKGKAIERAAKDQAYTIWGVTAFIDYQAKKKTINEDVPLQLVVSQDSLMQRMMVTVVVNPDKIGNVNATGAAAFQKYLLSPEVQAQIRAFRYGSVKDPVFVPAGRNNEDSVLP